MPNGNYTYVIDSSFHPFTMQEMLVPLTAYKDAYEKTEAAYDELSQKAGDFEYLSQTLPEGSEARRIYEGYANDLKIQAEDLARNGLTMNNRRALSSLKRRYQGEIGRLEKANARLMEQQKIRNEHLAKGLPMLYTEDNLSIDQFLDNNTPNLYSINSDDLYNRGAVEGKTISSRMYEPGDGGSTLGGYYRLWVERNGISPESIGAFMNSDFVKQRARAILAERGADNLTGNNYERALQSVMNGIYNGIIYQESAKPVRDEGVLTKAQRTDDARAEKQLRLQAALHGFTEDKDGNFTYNPEANPANIDSDNTLLRLIEQNGGKIPDGYQYNPRTRKLEKLPSLGGNNNTSSPEDKKSAAILKMNDKGRDNFSSAYGFDVTFGADNHHYDYVAGIEHGKDGYKKTSINSNKGRIKLGDNEEMRVLSMSDISNAFSDISLNEAFNAITDEYLKSIGKDPTDSSNDLDVQIVEIKNRINGKKRYLVAVHNI